MHVLSVTLVMNTRAGERNQSGIESTSVEQPRGNGEEIGLHLDSNISWVIFDNVRVCFVLLGCVGHLCWVCRLIGLCMRGDPVHANIYVLFVFDQSKQSIFPNLIVGYSAPTSHTQKVKMMREGRHFTYSSTSPSTAWSMCRKIGITTSHPTCSPWVSLRPSPIHRYLSTATAPTLCT
jgi:hypothetical protein